MHPKQLHNYNMQKGGVGEHCHEKAWYIQENMVTADKEFHGYAYPKSDEVVEHAKEMYYQQSPKEESRHEYSRKKPRKTRHCVEGSDLVEITKNDSVMEHEEILYQQSSKKRRHELDEYPHNEPGKTMHRGKNSLPRETAENPQVPPGKKPQRRVRYAKGTSSGQKKSLPPQPLQTLDNSTVVMANGYLNLPEVIKDDTLPDDEVSNEEKKVTRQPKCAKCKNHHIDVLVKGHKHFCPYKKCNCKLCEIVKNRQDIMKRQISLTRYQKEVEARKLRARILRARILRAKQLQLVGIQKDEVEQLEAQELEAEQLEAQEEDIEQVEVPEENEEASLDVVGISSGNVTPEPKHASAFATSQANSIVDYKRLRESLHQVTSQFGSSSPGIVNALYITVLKDNEYNYETVKKKIEESKRDARNIGVPLHSPQEGPATPPSSHCSAFVSPTTYSSSPATPILSSLVLPYNNPFYAYGPYGPAHPHPQLLDQTLLHHHHHPATPLFWHPSTPSGSPAGGVVTPDAVRYGGGGASNSIPASNNSGEESRGSQPSPGDYKDDSDDKGQSPHTSHKDLVTYVPKVHAAAMAAMRNHSSLATSLENHRRYMTNYELNYHQDRRETAANA